MNSMPSTSLSASEIQELIPHSGNMSLIDSVSYWDKNLIHCWTKSHLCSNNPLRTNLQLHSTILIEYGAQAAAIHASLSSASIDKKMGTAFLASVKHTQWKEETIPQDDEAMELKAEKEHDHNKGAIYTFQIHFNHSPFSEGKLILMQP